MRGVLSIEVDEMWPAIEPLVRAGLEFGDGRWAPEDIRAALTEGAQQLWIDGDPMRAICVTEIIRYPQQRRCNIFLLAGQDLDAWIWQLSILEAWAREKGCKAMELHGRPGWERILPGYDRTAVVLRKELA